MIGNSGIDQDVQAKMNAYRGNPQALAQQYQQGQQLIDLLALQKLKSEKEAAAREMQLKMGGQQMPTVGQALESEVLDLTKQELAQNTAGAMQTKQNQEQQAAKDLVARTAQMPTPSLSPMVQGVAGLPANNMTTRAMATGGIVAFQEGGRSEADATDPRLNEEMMRFIAEQQRAREGERPAPRQDDMGSLARQGIRNLIGTRTPDETFRQRTKEATEAFDYTPAERAIMQRQVADRGAFDAQAYSPEKQGLEALTRFLIGGANRSNVGSMYAGAAANSENYKASMRDADRARLVDRQKQEANIVDVSPAARMAGMKFGGDSEKNAIYGLAQGTGDAVRLEQLAAQAVARGDPAEGKKLTGAARQISGDVFLREGSKLLSKLVQENRTDDPIYNQTLRDMEARQNQIYKLWKIDNPEIPMPSQAAAPAAPPPSNRSLWTPDLGRIFGSGTPPAPQPRVVPFSSIPRE